MRAPPEVVADPWDEGLRLAWADRIADQHPERAALIRVSLEIRGLRRRGVVPPRAMVGQESRLLEAHHRDWSAHVAPLAQFCSLGAGCVEEASFTAVQWLEHGCRFRQTEPLLDVRITRVAGRLDAVLDTDLGGLRYLQLGDGLGDEAVARIARCPALKDLCALGLAGNDAGEAALVAIAEHLPELQVLDFRFNRADPRPTVAEEGGVVHGVWPSDVGATLAARYGARRWLARSDLHFLEGLRPLEAVSA